MFFFDTVRNKFETVPVAHLSGSLLCLIFDYPVGSGFRQTIYMFSKQGFFYLICLVGYFVILANYVPVTWDRDIEHISIIPQRNSSDMMHEFIDYRRLALYLIMWTVICFFTYKIVDQIKLPKK